MKYIKSYNESLFSIRKEGIDTICKKYKIEYYTINDDLSIDIDGDIDLSNFKLVKLPLKFNKVNGNFDCSNNKLITLDGFPKYVEGYFDCSNNKLITLVGSPAHVGGEFYCYHNKITNLIGCPINCRFINANSNKITCLDGWDRETDIEYHQNPLDNLTTTIISDIANLAPNDIYEKMTELECEIDVCIRMEEFEVIKDNNKLDLISLNSLFDFYQIPFDEKRFKRIKGYAY